MKGISGPIEFKEGRRIQFKLDLLKLKQHSLVKVGEWRPDAGVNVTDTAAFFEPGIANVTLIVITILEQPYVMLKSGGNFSGDARYEGFCIDLLKEIARMVGFTYRIELVPDGKYGVYDYETGEWNGIVRQLMDKKYARA
nr:PREDICTED: glutamate receptor ionotropic, kainate 2-like [Linepithema humile]